MTFTPFAFEYYRESDDWFSGTDDNVKIKLIGGLAESKWVTLNNKWNNDFEAGDTNKFEIGFKVSYKCDISYTNTVLKVKKTNDGR